MSNNSQNNNADLSQRFYNNQSKVVTDQIRNNYTNDNKVSNQENQDLMNFNSSIEYLTTKMNIFLENEKTPNSRAILGKSENDFEKSLAKADKSYINHSLRTGLVETPADHLTIIQQNTRDPLYSVSRFEDLKLKPELLNGISSMGFRKPSAIQEKALPMLLENNPRNFITQSQSGTGKTATFLLTMLSKVDVNDRFCQCLCMAPTRELAKQISAVASQMAKFMPNLKITEAIKGDSPSTINGEIDSQIVIGTPGTLKHWTTENSHLYLNPKKLKVFVLDEADILIETAEFLNIAKRIKSKVTTNCQILLFSATYDDQVMEFAKEFVPNPTEFTVKPRELTLKNIKQYYLKVMSDGEKYNALIEIYGKRSIGQCIIFCESRRIASALKDQLEKDSHLSSLLTGELDFRTRQQEIEHFRTGKSRVLIATNLCSRGIDIPQVNLIINWNMPRTKETQADCETYLHRIGRSGRFGKIGLTINFIGSIFDLEIQNKIIETYGAQIEELKSFDILAVK